MQANPEKLKFDYEVSNNDLLKYKNIVNRISKEKTSLFHSKNEKLKI